MQILYKTALVFTIIGALNWGLIGLLDFNLVSAIFGEDTMLSNAVYTIVGISGLICIPILFKRLHEHEKTTD